MSKAEKTAQKTSASLMGFDEGMIRKLADILTETGLTEIEIAKDDLMIRVGRGGGMMTTSVMNVGTSALPAANAAGSAAIPAKDHAGAVKSPMVGVAYLASEPGAPAFISVGDKVSEGQTLLIIEAMKVMNPIKATKGGTVKEIFIQNGQPVEFDEVLVIIE